MLWHTLLLTAMLFDTSAIIRVYLKNDRMVNLDMHVGTAFLPRCHEHLNALSLILTGLSRALLRTAW